MNAVVLHCWFSMPEDCRAQARRRNPLYSTKSEAGVSDLYAMLTWPLEIWLIFALIAGAAVTALLQVVSATIDDERRIATLRQEVNDLRAEHAEKVHAMKVRRGLIVDESGEVSDADLANPVGKLASSVDEY